MMKKYFPVVFLLIGLVLVGIQISGSTVGQAAGAVHSGVVRAITAVGQWMADTELTEEEREMDAQRIRFEQMEARKTETP